MAIFEGKKSSHDIENNDTMSDDEVVASYVPPRYLFSLSLSFPLLPIFLPFCRSEDIRGRSNGNHGLRHRRHLRHLAATLMEGEKREKFHVEKTSNQEGGLVDGGRLRELSP